MIDLKLAAYFLGDGNYTVKDGVPGFQHGSAFKPWTPSTDWATLGPLVECYKIELSSVDRDGETLWAAGAYDEASDRTGWSDAETLPDSTSLIIRYSYLTAQAAICAALAALIPDNED